MKTAFALCIVICCFLVLRVKSAELEGKCLPGNNHKAKPGPEGPEYQACRVFKEKSCCTANFTKELTVPVIQNVLGFSWNLCGNLSKRCQEFMIGVECFYRCSPYVGYWEDPNEKQAFNHAPVCSSYCDSWFEACKTDMTCARNWIKDMHYPNGTNVCKNATCRTFGDTFANGKDLCENLWDDSFNYTTSDKSCLHFNFTGSNPNKEVVMKLFGGNYSSTTPASPTTEAGDNSSSTSPTSPTTEAGDNSSSTSPTSPTTEAGDNSAVQSGLHFVIVALVLSILVFA